LDFRKGMKLVEVEVVGLKFLEGIMELRGGSFPVALQGFAGKENILAERCERRAHPVLGIGVARGDIEIVDAVVDGFTNELIGGFLRFFGQDETSQANDRELLSRLAEGTPGERFFRKNAQQAFAGSPAMKNSGRADSRGRNRLEEYSSFLERLQFF
jgi:hypothetical protein